MTSTTTIDEALSNGKDTSASAIKERAVEALDQGIETAKHKINEASAQAKTELTKMSDKGTTFVRENPSAAIAGAVGFGLFLGLVMRGRR